jgi:Ser/Thr protein kinase RdoA (MazF antagonist)
MIFKRLHSEPEDRGREELPKGNRREVAIYRRLLSGRRFGAPELYASVYDEVHERHWLFLEDVGDRTLEKADMDAWFAAARWLAEMHGAYLGREDELRAFDCLQEHGPEYYHMIARIARQNLVLAGSAELVRFDQLMRDFGAVVACLSFQPRTLVHGDVFPQNLMIQPGPCIRAVDWESAAIGLPALDLARLLDGWEGQERQSLVSSYRETLELHARAPIDAASIELALDQCRLVVALIHLAWELWPCQDAAFVHAWLTSMEWSWQHLGRERAGG